MGNFNISDIKRDNCQLYGKQSKSGYDRWWQSFTAYNAKTGKEKVFFIEFFLCNPALAEKEPVLGQLEDNRQNGKRPSYLMVNVGTFGKDARQLHRFFGWKKIRVKMGTPFFISADDCYLGERRTYGKVKISKEEAEAHPEYMTDAGELIWNLTIKKKIAFNAGYGAGELSRKLQLFEMYWHAEGMKSSFSGEIYLDGERYEVDPKRSYGYSDKSWGKDYTSTWLWLASSNLYSRRQKRKLKNSAFDIGGGRPKLGPFAFEKKLLSAVWYEHLPLEFNFTKFWEFPTSTFKCRESKSKISWHVDQRTVTSRVVADIKCNKNDMLLMNYEAPDGKRLHKRLWNGGNGKGSIRLYRFGRLIDRIECRNVGCGYGED